MVRRGETEVKHRIYTALDGELFKHDGDAEGDVQVSLFRTSICTA